MTDPTDLDELVSAYLDDEVSAEERARVEADPDLRARVERMRAVADELRTGFAPLDDAEATRQRRRALNAREEGPMGAVAPPRVRPRPRWLPSPAAAAAILVLIGLVGIGLLISSGASEDSADTAASGPSRTSADEGSGGGSPEATQGGAAEDNSNDELAGLGSFASEAELTRALEAVDVTTLSSGGFSSSTASTPPASGKETESELRRCDTTVEAQGDLGPRLAVATAELAARPVLVFSHPVRDSADAPVTQLTVVDTETCEVLFAVRR